MIDLRFPTALQMVLSLAVARENRAHCTSTGLASGLGANPALVRKLIVPLARDGIVIATSGKNGGVRLGRSPESITLRDVYLSVVDDKRLFATRPNVPSVCVVSTNIGTFFESITDDAEQAMLAALAQRTVAESITEIRAIETQRAGFGRHGQPNGN